jgi:hypothetical protein
VLAALAFAIDAPADLVDPDREELALIGRRSGALANSIDVVGRLKPTMMVAIFEVELPMQNSLHNDVSVYR